jgi:serine/threonine-protein kinase RsbW
LAVYEALANVAEYAYQNSDGVGTVDLLALHDDASTLLVIVADRGRWRTATTAADRTRGRGIPLMQALTNHCSLHNSAHGSTVRLVWSDVAPR